jgi:metallo-beta-lactamase class B
MESLKVFDNVYFVGTKWVSAWAITTYDGIILIDALNNDAEAERFITGGLRKLGLDPAQIKYLVISHAHGDHYGGARHLVEKYHPRVVMSEVDWGEPEKPVLQFDNALRGPAAQTRHGRWRRPHVAARRHDRHPLSHILLPDTHRVR